MHIILLHVNDMPAIRDSYEMIFEDISNDAAYTNTYEVISAVDGLDAMVKIKKRSNDINLVISDIKMPRIDGFELLELVVKEYSIIPVILYSAYGTEASKHRIVNELGAFATFEIPPNIDDLIKIVDRAATWHFQKKERG